MVVANVMRQQAFQVPLIESDHMIKQIAPAASDPALRHTVLPGTAEGGSDGLKSDRLHGCEYFDSELGIAVIDQISMLAVVRKCLPELLGYPQTGGMLGSRRSAECDDGRGR